MTVIEFWRSTFALPRVGLSCAAILALMNAASFFGLGTSHLRSGFALVVFAVMALCVLVFMRLDAFRDPYARPEAGMRTERSRIPKALVWATVLSILYLLALWIILPAVAERPSDAQELRLMSAHLLVFALVFTWVGHRAEERLRR